MHGLYFEEFEVGRVFLVSTDPAARLPEERVLASGIRAGRRQSSASVGEANAETDFYDAKGAVEEALFALRLRDVGFAPAHVPYLHPRASAEVRVGERVVGVVGEVHPEVAKSFDIEARAYVFELDVSTLATLAQPVVRFAELPRFPSTYRDMAVVVDGHASCAKRSGYSTSTRVGLFPKVKKA